MVTSTSGGARPGFRARIGGRVNILRAWGRILQGYRPTLSLEITKECPLRCPGCYAYEPEHLGAAGPLRDLSDFRGDDLVTRVLRLVEETRPVYISIVGGEPLVRYRELNALLPRLSALRIPVQVVTSAVRPLPAEWRTIPGLHLCVSIDGLRPEHDARRAPATYDRILENVAGHRITVHCTVTGQMARQPGSFEEFLTFWSERDEVRKIWFSLFTPQVGADGVENLTAAERQTAVRLLGDLRRRFPKLDLHRRTLQAYLTPPSTPADCLFARTTNCVSADLETPIHPCQLGGDPDCSRCGCLASAGMKALGDLRLAGVVPVRSIYAASEHLGAAARRRREARPSPRRSSPAR
ncbi:MAG TPA: radical SAM protein [Candidatus Polarisedimenticolia bacterium]|nr:radical SAM protein [Candidatus Polarisedimenticolia bacterium]